MGRDHTIAYERKLEEREKGREGERERGRGCERERERGSDGEL